MNYINPFFFPIFSAQTDHGMFAGLSVTQGSNSPKTTPTISSMRKIDYSNNHLSSSPSPQTTQQPLGTWQLPSTDTIPSTTKQNLFSDTNFTTNVSSRHNSPNVGSHTGMGTKSPVLGTKLLQPNPSTSRSSISTEPTSGMGMKTLDSGSGNEWSSSVRGNKPISGLGTGLLQPTITSDWSNSMNEPTAGMGTQSSNIGTRSRPGNGWSSSTNNNNTSFGLQSSQGMGVMQPSTGLSANIDESTSRNFGMGIQPSNMGTGILQSTGILQPNPSTGWSTSINESGNLATGMQQSNSPAGGWSSNINTRPQGMGMSTQPQGMGMSTQSQGMGMSTRPQGMGMGAQPQGMGILQPQTASDWSSNSNTSGWSSNFATQTSTSQAASTGQRMGTQQVMSNSTDRSNQQGIAPGPNPFADFNSLI